MIETLRSVLRFGPVERDPVARRLARRERRRPAPHRAPPVPARRLRLHRRRGRGRTHAGRERSGLRPFGFRPRVLRDVSAVDPATTLLGRRCRCRWCSRPRVSPASPTRRASWRSRARRRVPACRTRSPPLAPARSRKSPPSARLEVVPGVRVAGSGAGRGNGRPGRGRRLRGIDHHRRHRGVR